MINRLLSPDLCKATPFAKAVVDQARDTMLFVFGKEEVVVGREEIFNEDIEGLGQIEGFL